MATVTRSTTIKVLTCKKLAKNLQKVQSEYLATLLHSTTIKVVTWKKSCTYLIWIFGNTCTFHHHGGDLQKNVAKQIWAVSNMHKKCLAKYVEYLGKRKKKKNSFGCISWKGFCIVAFFTRWEVAGTWFNLSAPADRWFTKMAETQHLEIFFNI